MNDRSDGHLTANQISQWLIEGPAIGTQAHLLSCEACQAKLAEASAPLTDLRAAFTGWSEAQETPAVPAAARAFCLDQPRLGRRSWFWLPAAAVGMATLLLVAFLSGSGVFAKRPGGGRLPELSDTTDTALMDQVDAEVSEAVPDAMAPLTDLVAWDSTEPGATAEKRAVHRKAATVVLKAKSHSAK